MSVLLLADEPIPAWSADAIRVRHRAELLGRRGGGALLAPASADGPLLVPGVRHHPAPVPPGADVDHREALVAEQAAAAIDQHRPAVVHAFGIRAAVPALMRARHGVRVVVEPGRTPSQRMRAIEPPLPPSRLEELVALEDKTLARADAVIARSPTEAAHLAKRGVRPDRLWTVTDGLPLPDAGEHPLPDLPMLTAVVAYAPDEAAELVLRALARLEAPWRLTLLGPGDWSTGNTEHIARALEIAHRVTYARLDADAPLRVAGAQAVICGLPWDRSVQAGAIVPEAVLWALACRRPVVAPDVPVVRAYAGAAARYYAHDDIDALRGTLRAVLGERGVRAVLLDAVDERRAALDWHGADAAIGDVWSVLREG